MAAKKDSTDSKETKTASEDTTKHKADEATDTVSAQKDSKDSKATTVVGIVIAVLVGIGVFTFIMSDEGYSDQVRENYVDSCVEASGQQSLCTCTYDKLSSQLSYSEFKALDERANSGETTQEDQELVSGIAFACVAEAQSN